MLTIKKGDCKMKKIISLVLVAVLMVLALASCGNISQSYADKINKAKQSGNRVISVGTTSTRTLESAALEDGTVPASSGDTDIFIYPGYRFKAVDCLITNFHLPESTLVMLVSALAGRDKIMNAYEEAVRQKYRFFSFGDAMFINHNK